jgi:hypothetical protein
VLVTGYWAEPFLNRERTRVFSPTWDLRFADGDQQISAVLDCDQGRVLLVGTDRQATLIPHLASAYRTRLSRWLRVEVADPVTAAED